MPKDIASDSDISSLETHFVERENDGEVLWEVEEIVGEKGRKYRVRWAGVDERGRPWPLDWVPKEDCTDPLVLNWKRKKAETKRLQEERKRKTNPRHKTLNARASIMSKDSAVTSSTTSHSTVVRSTKSKLSTVVAGKKRKNNERVERDQSTEFESDIVVSSRPKKKRKIAAHSSGSSRAMLSEDNSDTPPPDRKSKNNLSRSKKLPQTKPEPVYYEVKSDSDAEPPAKDFLKQQRPPSISIIPTDLVSKRVSPTSKRKGSKRFHEEEDIFTTTKVPQPVVSKKPRLVKPPVTTTRPPPTKRPSTHTSRSPSPSNSLSLSPSKDLVPSLPSTSKQHGTLEAALNKTFQEEDDNDSALEYADLPPSFSPRSPPAPLSGQPPKPAAQLYSPSPSSSPPSAPSPPTSPATTPKGKGRALEPDPEIVPETEGEESQNRKNDELAVLRSPLTTRNSMVSRMKPRTPGSKRNIADIDIVASPLPFSDHHTKSVSPLMRPKKALHPIPQISPSKFTNMPSSTIESAETTGDGKDGYDSTIEQFDSPDKSSLARIGNEEKEKEKETEVYLSSEGSNSSGDGSLPIPPAATDVINKGVAMADAAKRGKLNGNGVVGADGVTQAQPRLPLSTVFEKEREREKSRASSVGSDAEDMEEVGKQGPPSSLEEFADSFVDYEGGVGGKQAVTETGLDSNSRTLQDTNGDVVVMKEKVYLREEEEESTQDLMMELQQRQREVPDVDESWTNSPVPVEPVSIPVPVTDQVPLTSQQQSSDEDMANVIDSLEVAPKSSGPIADTSLEESESVKPPELSQHSVPQDSPSRRLDNSMFIPATLSPTRSEEQVMNLFPSQSSSGDDQPQLEPAMTALHRESEELSRLEDLLSTAQTTIQSLEVERANHEVAVISWRAEKSKLFEDTELLRESLQKALDRMTFIEKNAEVFRDQYVRASAFVAETRQENMELKERVEVAEAQASTGLEGIKRMYDLRIQRLEEETGYHKRVTNFLIEQSMRTQDDEIRRMAGEYPELERICGELKGRIGEMEEMMEGSGSVIDTLERLVTQKDKENERLRKEKWEAEERMREELESLKKELEESRRKEVDSLSCVEDGNVNGEVEIMAKEVPSSPITNGDGTVDVNHEKEKVGGEIQVYRCLWRKNGTEHCDAMFLTQEALSHHLEYGGHIP